MAVLRRLFSFRGRIGRLEFWLKLFIAAVVQCVGLLLAVVIPVALLSLNHPYSPGMPSDAGMLGVIVMWQALSGLTALIAGFMVLSALCRRLHDHDKGSLWMLLLTIPVLGWLWLIAECGFIAGTQGANRFGPSPKDESDPSNVKKG